VPSVRENGMSPELVLAAVIRDWAALVPGEPRIGEVAVQVALATYAAGGSVSESWGLVRSFVDSWARHPARRQATARVPVDVAS